MFGIVLHYLLGFGLIVLHLALGNLLVGWAKLPIPGSVVGMVLMAASLHVGLVPVARVRRTSGLLLRHMALFFVPPGVGLMLYFDLLSREWPAIVAAGVVSTVAVMLVVGWIEQRLEPDD